MRALSKLLGNSPFAPLKTHMEKVHLCINKLTHIFEDLDKLSLAQIEELSKELSELEHEADITKNDIRNHLRGIFLPIERSQFLEMLSLQDGIADKAEDIANLLTLHPIQDATQLRQLYLKNLEAYEDAAEIIGEIDELVESSFGGMEAEKVKRMVEKTAYKEYEADKAKHALTKELFAKAETLSTPVFYLWIRLIEEVSALSHLSERLANRIRMVLEVK
ncbi:MAG: TIGR00153 family protein [Chlamydiia bacterium]|nr:TIGR00153 family protein [Chlamydiia bacterium]